MKNNNPVEYSPENFDEEKVSIIAELKGSLQGMIPDNLSEKDIRELRHEDRRKKYENLS